MKAIKNRNPYILCERCGCSIKNLYSFKGFDLCGDCYETMNMVYNPKFLTKSSLDYYKNHCENQKMYFSAFGKRFNVLNNIKKCSQNDFTYLSEIKPTTSYKKENGVWVETHESPLAFFELQQLQIMVFEEIIRIYQPVYNIVYNIAAKGLRVESCFVHTSKDDITKGNEMLAFCGELIYKTDEGIRSEVTMGKILAIYDVRRTIISEKYSVRFEKECSPLKDWVYYISFIQAIKINCLNEDYTLKDVLSSLYNVLKSNASEYHFILEEDRADHEEKRYYNSDSSNDDVVLKKMFEDALEFFGLDYNYSLKDLKKKRNVLLKQYHPDNAGTDMAKYSDFSQKTQMINIFYDLLESVANGAK